MATRTISNAGGNWNSTASWVEGVVPTSADDVVATGTSGALTINVAAACRSINLTGYTSTLTHTGLITLAIGNGTAPPSNAALIFPTSGWTYTLNGSAPVLSFVGDSGTVKTVSFGGKTVPSLTFTTNNSTTHRFTSGFAMSAGEILTIDGALDFNGQTVTVAKVYSLNSANITLGASVITQNSTPWDVTTSGTLSAGTSSITVAPAGTLFRGSTAHTYNNITWAPIAAGNKSIKNVVCQNLTLSSTTAGQGVYFKLESDVIVNGTFTATGASATNRIIVTSDLTGVPRTLSAGTTSLTNVDFRDIAATGTAAWTGTVIGNCLGNSGITHTSPVTRYWVGGGGGWTDVNKWSTASGGSGGASTPLPQDSVIFDANSFTGVQTSVIPSTFRRVPNFTMATATNSPTLSLGGLHEFYGSFILSSVVTMSVSVDYDLMGRGSHTIISAGKNLTQGSSNTKVYLDAPGGTYSLGDATTIGEIFYIRRGTFTTNNHNMTVGSFQSVVLDTRVVNLGTSTITATDSGSVWAITGPGLTLNASASTLALTDTTSTAKTFAGGGFTYGTVTTAGGTGQIQISGANTFGTFTPAPGSSLRFVSGTTNTFTNFNASGTAGNLITIVSSSAGSPATFSKSSGIVASDYLSLKDTTATGGATWYAGSHSTNVSGNTGWSFTLAPTAVTYAVAYVTEASAAQTPLRQKRLLLSSPVETSSSTVPITGAHKRSITSVAEGSTAGSISSRKRTAVSYTTEAGSILSPVSQKLRIITAVTELNSVTSFALSTPVGYVIETSSTGQITASKRLVVSFTLEDETTGVGSASKVRTVAYVVETGSAGSIRWYYPTRMAGPVHLVVNGRTSVEWGTQ